MKGVSPSYHGLRLTLGLFLALALALAGAAVASAQQSSDGQYGAPASPSGPAANAQCTVAGDTDNVVNAGDEITCAGNFSVSAGSSATLQDSDNTQGTFLDGDNADITEGSLDIAVTGNPANVNGGNRGLNTDGLFVVTTTGVAAGDSSSGSSALSAVTGVLPDTGGPLIVLALGILAVGGTGLTLLRRRYATRQ